MGNQASRLHAPDATVGVAVTSVATGVAAVAGHTVAPVATAAAAAYQYGTQLATDPNPSLDFMGLRPRLEKVSKSVDSLEDRGYLKRYRVCGLECLGVAGLPLEQVEQPPHYPLLRDADTAVGGELCPNRPIFYHTKTVGSKVHIPKEQVPAFLLDNGIPLMDAEEMGKHLKAQMSKAWPIKECTCVGKYNVKGHAVVTTLGQCNMEGLKPGDARYRIRIDEDFSSYKADPIAYEEKLRVAIMDALGLDSAKIPGAKKQIKIERVEEGSVIVDVVIGIAIGAAAVFLAAVACWAGYHAGRRIMRVWAKMRSPEGSPSGGTRSASRSAGTPGRRPSDDDLGLMMRQPTHVSLRSYVDDDWEVVCQLNEAPRCHLKDTLFRMPQGQLKTAFDLREGEDVLGLDGEKMNLTSKEVLGSKKRNLVTLRTAQAEITVTSSHRVAVMDQRGIRSEETAGALKPDDLILCGNRSQKLTKVIKFQRDTEVVELAFFPDEPVETFNAPSWPIYTLGQRHHAAVGSFGPLGPRTVTGESGDASDGRIVRSRSF